MQCSRNKQQQIMEFLQCANILQTSVAAPSHQELKVCDQFGDWIRNDIQYCSFQAGKILNFFMKAWQYFLGLWSDICSLCKISILKENLESFIPILPHSFQFTSPWSSASATPCIVIAAKHRERLQHRRTCKCKLKYESWVLTFRIMMMLKPLYLSIETKFDALDY